MVLLRNGNICLLVPIPTFVLFLLLKVAVTAATEVPLARVAGCRTIPVIGARVWTVPPGWIIELRYAI